MDCTNTNPITSNQVIEVGLNKPKCLDFKGNSLNDWLKWLAEKECEIDWSDFDLSCITSESVCDQTQKVVIQSLLDSVCSLNENKETIFTEEIKTIEANVGWTTTRAIKIYKRGRLIHLSGLVTGGATANSIFTLPTNWIPANDLTVPVAHAFGASAAYNIFLKIKANGDVVLAPTGSSYAATSPNVYLDGISFFI